VVKNYGLSGTEGGWEAETLMLPNLIEFVVISVSFWGGLGYHKRSPVSRRRRWKGNPVCVCVCGGGGYNWLPCHWGGIYTERKITVLKSKEVKIEWSKSVVLIIFLLVAHSLLWAPPLILFHYNKYVLYQLHFFLFIHGAGPFLRSRQLCSYCELPSILWKQ
jgi:hypothetical protein